MQGQGCHNATAPQWVIYAFSNKEVFMFDLSSPKIFDKIYGCWMGKNCGGTLGAPLEKGYGEPEPFDVWWYPKLQDGGIPNDDLEMQLVWLKALEEVGPALKARDLAEYWLNHIGYNWDEYGWARMNMRLGLMPPVAGGYNNWFIDCMGCPIRSEIFACVAPGLPRLAVRYAYEDAICDHAGGESVYGEMFNTAIESAAFIHSDLNQLLDIGRSYVPDGSQTALAIDAARAAHRAGLDWKAARKKVLSATPHYNSQYSPINMGFQTIGLLYGRDFAESICIAVNCGYDTDCTGATVGAILGILNGNSGLPEKWTRPLGDSIATNESWGGLRAVSACPNPIPKNLDELTRRTIAQAVRISAGHTPAPQECYADDSIRKLWGRCITRVNIATGTFDVGVDYLNTPAVVPGTEKPVHTVITNQAPVPLRVQCTLQAPEGWPQPGTQQLDLPANGEIALTWKLHIPGPRLLDNTNRLTLRLDSPQRIAQSDCPVVLIGARRLRISKPQTLPDATAAELLEHSFEPEALHGANDLVAGARHGLEIIHHALGHDLALAPVVPAGHAIYAQAFVRSAKEREVILGLPTTGSVKSWLNGELVHHLLEVEPFRPHAHKTQPYITVRLRAGFNEVLMKFVRPAGAATFDAHMIFADPADQNAGIVDLLWTRFPWD